MQDALKLHELLASEITRAALRADHLEPREFMATLEAAAQRIGARKRGSQPTTRGLGRLNAGCGALPCFGA